MLTACIALLLWAAPSQGMSTYCEIPSVEEMQNTSLTCKFSDDMTKLKQNFQVQFYKSDTTDSPDDILNCLWADNKLECQVHKCCEYDSHVTEHLTVRVLNVTKARVGRYACFVVPAAPDSYEFCNFTLREKHQTVTSESSHAALAALVVISVIICIIITIFVWRRKRSDNTDGLQRPVHTDKMDNDDSEENSNQHPKNISKPEEELLLQQPVGEAQTDLTETDSCERTVKHKFKKGTEEGANTTEGISNTIKMRDIDFHSDLTRFCLDGNDAQTATQESDLFTPSAVPLQKPGDDTTDSKPHAAKRIPPLVITESEGKSHPMMLPQNTKQRKKGGRFWKSAGAMNNPQKALIKQYNRTAEDEEANRSKNELEKKRSPKARKTLEQSKGGKTSKKTESVPPIINVESSQQSHIGAFSESLSLPQSSSSVNDNCTDISKTTVINRDEHSIADSSTDHRNVLQDNNPSHGTNVSSCEIDMGTCTSTNDSEDSSGLTVQSGSRQPCTSSETAKEFTVTLNEFEQEVYGEETKPKSKNRILNVMRFGSKGGKNKTKGMKPKDMATPQEP